MGLPENSDELGAQTKLVEQTTAAAPVTTAAPVSAEVPRPDIGEIGYNAYCADRDWKAFNGEPLPQWPEVKEDIKRAWRKAGLAVVEAFDRSTVQIFSEEPPKPA